MMISTMKGCTCLKLIKFTVIAAIAISSLGILHADEGMEVDKSTHNSLWSIIMDSCNDDTVFIPCDIYINSSTVRLVELHDVCIRFEPGAQVLTDDVYLDVIKLIGCSNIQILGGYFRHVDPLPEDDCHGGVIIIHDCSDVTIDNCTVSGCGAMGFSIVRSENIDIRHCLIEDNSYCAFYLRSFNNLHINHCIIRNNGRFFYSNGHQDLTNLKMRNNEIYSNNSYFYDDEIPGLRD